MQEYLDELPADRRAVVSAVRDVVLRNLPKGYRESMSWGVISYEIPLEHFPDTYNGQPLGYIALAAQKNHYALYLMCFYGNTGAGGLAERGVQEGGKKLDKGKSCLRFRKLEDLPLDVIGQAVAKVTPEKYIAWYEANRRK